MNIITSILICIWSIIITILRLLRDQFRRWSAGFKISSKTSGSRRRVMVSVAIFVIVGSLVSLAITMRNPPLPINTAPFIGLGQALAEETISVLHNQGRIGVILANGTQKKGTLAGDQWRAFQEEITKHSAISIAATEIVTFEVKGASNSVPGRIEEPKISPEKFVELVKRDAQFDGLVSFVGLPLLNPERPLALPSRRPKIIAYQTSGAVSKRYFLDDIAAVIISPRANPALKLSATAKKTQDWFAIYFQILTAANTNSLPE